jgi:hypothetical protein
VNAHRLRCIALGIVVAALLVFANTCQLEMEASSRFESGNYLTVDVDAVVATRSADVVAHAWLEYAACVIAGAGLVLATRLR